MQTESSASSTASAAYDERPWLKHYPSDVPHSVEFPRQTVWEVLQDVAARHGGREAYIFQNDPMTFAQLLRQSEAMSRALARAGVRKGDSILAFLPNVPHFPVLYYGALRLGASIAAVSPRSVERELENFIKDSGARIVFTIDLLYEKLGPVWEESGAERVVVGSAVDFMPAWKRVAARVTGKLPQPKQPVPYGSRVVRMRDFLSSGRGYTVEEEAEPDDVALLQYTGGTTGLPKAAMLTHANLLANARQSVVCFPEMKEAHETIMGVLPFFHIYGITLVLNCGLVLAARTVLFPKGLDMAEIFEGIRRYRPTVFPGVPTIYVALIHDKRSKSVDMSSIEMCVSGGAPLPVEVKRDFERITGGRLVEGYGLSEASPVTHAEPHDNSGKPGSIGLPLPNTDARIVGSDALEGLPVGEAGELAIRGPQVMRGYWNRPQDTADVLQDGWLRTGDIARMDDDGFFYIVDRKKDLIITAGENIYPREIEEVYYEHPKIQEVAVVGVPNITGGEVAKAFIVLKPGESSTKQEMTKFGAERLAKHKVPRAFDFRDDLPKSAAGKVLRRVLAEQERARVAARDGKRSVPPGDEAAPE